MLQTNPYLVLATALYLACKVEECPQHIRYIHNKVRYHYSGGSRGPSQYNIRVLMAVG